MVDATQAVPQKSLKQWHSPDSRQEVIHELIHGVDRYNPSNLPYMEEYLSSQIKDGEYDLLANLAILKLYQFNPQMSNPEVIINILLKSLSATVHGPDFNLCLSLLREPAAILHDIESDEQSLITVMPLLQELHTLLRTCQFTAFWKTLNGDEEGAQILRQQYLPQQPHLESSLRILIATSIASCFSRVPIARLSNWINLSSSDLSSWSESIGWKVEGDVAVVPKNGDNDVKAGVVKESVELNQLTKLVSAAAF
ncbi:armadillo-type protein [Kockovaella imperatae]|uniref:Eukaryotic translation initiation factor 3 subunit K n=1 Tax=Kockovaella imperatae TaxID=4999 RepID=A0A1Y1URC2_9TREE|nr:armadillo-type protein [Kockovaella imperatae]ORX40157.1 armadillo-type protein [Kockovaella imperatae]